MTATKSPQAGGRSEQVDQLCRIVDAILVRSMRVEVTGFQLDAMRTYLEALETENERLRTRVAQLGNICGKCPICKDRVADTVHHLVPRQLGGAKDDPSMWGKRKVMICWFCHQALHKLATHQTLATKYRSIDLICNDIAFREAVKAKADQYHLHA